MLLVLDEADSQDDVGALQERGPDGGDHDVEPALQSVAVIRRGSCVVAEADDEHLHEATLEVPREVGVRLHAIHKDDAVGLSREAVHDERQAVHLAEIDHVERRAHGRPDAGLGDATFGEYFALTLAGGATVRAHGRDDERAAAGVAQPGHDGPYDAGQTVDAAAADAYRDPRVRRQMDPAPRRVPLPSDLDLAVHRGRYLEALLHEVHGQERHRGPVPGRQRAKLDDGHAASTVMQLPRSVRRRSYDLGAQRLR